MQRERDRLTAIAADVSWAAVTVTPDTNDGYLISGPQRPNLLPLFHPIRASRRGQGRSPGFSARFIDVAAPDVAWWQILGRGHLDRLGGPPDGAG
jgi:hypothetical protein